MLFDTSCLALSGKCYFGYLTYEEWRSSQFHDTGVSGKRHSSKEEDPGEDELSEHQIRAVSAAGLQGKDSRKQSVFSQTSVRLAIRVEPLNFQILCAQLML